MPAPVSGAMRSTPCSSFCRSVVAFTIGRGCGLIVYSETSRSAGSASKNAFSAVLNVASSFVRTGPLSTISVSFMGLLTGSSLTTLQSTSSTTTVTSPGSRSVTGWLSASSTLM